MKRISLIFIVILPMILASCQLAIEDNMVDTKDTLVGIFVSREYVDLYDFEGYLNDNLRNIKGNNIEVGYDEKYKTRIYGEKVVTKEAGLDYENEEYIFPGIEGIALMYITEKKDDGETYITNYSNDVSNLNYSAGDSIGVSGTVFSYATDNMFSCYFYPIYETNNGSIYITEGQALSTPSISGATLTSALEEENMVNINGDITTEKFKVSLTIEFIDYSIYKKIIYLDKEYNVLNVELIAIENIPEKIIINEDVEYIIIDKEKDFKEDDMDDGVDIIKRGSESFTYYKEGDRGFCLKENVFLEWE